MKGGRVVSCGDRWEVACVCVGEVQCLSPLPVTLERVWSFFLPPPWYPSVFLSVFRVVQVSACTAPPMSPAGSGVRSGVQDGRVRLML